MTVNRPVGAGFKPAPTPNRGDTRVGSSQTRRPRRQPLRLRDYDYTRPGAYFITICTHRRRCLFGRVADGAMHPNAFGAIVGSCWRALPRHYPHVELDGFVVMPNHVHGILLLTDAGVVDRPKARRHDLSEVVRAFKTFSAQRINELRGAKGNRLWQRGFYEHIIRRGDPLNGIRSYIETNPLRWHLDRENPNHVRKGGFQTRPYTRDGQEQSP